MARVLITHPSAFPKPVLDVALSERNLVVLLSKLYTPGSQCELTTTATPPEFAAAVLRVEPDAFHYAHPTRDGSPPGPMHPLAELVRAVIGDVVKEALRAHAARAGLGASEPHPTNDGPAAAQSPCVRTNCEVSR